MSATENTLAKRLGITAPESPLKWKLRRLESRFPSHGAGTHEAWLVDVANSRGATIVRRQELPLQFAVPEIELSNEELVVGVLLPCQADEPQMLRLSAQLISRGEIDAQKLLTLAHREGALRVLANLATLALRVAPQHPVWRAIARGASGARPLRENVLHWTRLAEPVIPKANVHQGEWRLVA